MQGGARTFRRILAAKGFELFFACRSGLVAAV